MSGFSGEGNSLQVVNLLEAACLLLEYPSSGFAGNLPLGSECWKIQLGGEGGE